MKSKFLKKIKGSVESLLNIHIYRGQSPIGAELFADIDRVAGLKNIRTVFDVGANVGQTAQHYHYRFPDAEIYAFEPVENTFRELQRSAAGHPRIHPEQCGMGAEPGEAVINVGSQNTNSSILHAQPDGKPETIRIDSITHFAGERNIASIDFLKLDTEGYELHVLEGARPMLQQGRISFIYVECEPFASNRNFVTLSSIGDFLVPLGYALFGIYDQTHFWEGKRSIHYFNAVFICERLASPA